MTRNISILPLLLIGLALCSQTQPVCHLPANGSDWSLIGPAHLPGLGSGARFSMTGTGAQIGLKFFDADQPNPKILYATTPTGGLFRTMDATAEMPIWENITDSTRLPVLGVQDVAFVPGDSNTILIGTGIRYPLDIRRRYGIGVLRSTDGGRSWGRTGLSFNPPGNLNEVCHEILIDPSDPSVVHVLCGPVYYRSGDAGMTYSRKKDLTHPCPAGWGASYRDIACKPGNSETLYLSTDGNFFYRSVDGGDTWEENDLRKLGVTAEIERMDIAVSDRHPEILYLACKSRDGEFILRSGNSGVDLEVIFHKRLQTSYEKHAISISPNDIDKLYLGGLNIYEITIDSSGASSRTISRGIHVDHRDLLAVDDGNGNDLLYSANDGGLYRGRITDPDRSNWEWEDISGTGMNNTQFYGIAVAQDFSVVLGGTQDVGVLVYRQDTGFFKPNIGGDGTDCAVDLYDPQYVYGTQWGISPPSVWRSTDGGRTFTTPIRTGFDGAGDPYYFPLEVHEDGALYSASNNLYRLPHKGETWEQLGELNLPTDLPYRVNTLCVSPSDPGVIYAYGDQVYKTENATEEGIIWKSIGESMGKAAVPSEGGGVVSAIEVDAANPDKVWVGFRTYDSDYKIYFSGDGGGRWSNTSAGLPPFPVNDLAFQAGTEDVLYAATDVGVYVNFNASDPNSEWTCFNNGLPAALVVDLEMNYCHGKIVAGTHGRGIWQSPFGAASRFAPVRVGKDQTMDYRIFRNHLVVGKGTELTLTGEIRFAEGAGIFLEKNSRLILDGAHLDAICDGLWGGIVIEDKLNFLDVLFGGQNGQVILRNGAFVENSILDLP